MDSQPGSSAAGEIASSKGPGILAKTHMDFLQALAKLLRATVLESSWVALALVVWRGVMQARRVVSSVVAVKPAVSWGLMWALEKPPRDLLLAWTV